MNLVQKPVEKKLKILILSAPVGSGHQMAADALAEALSRLDRVDVVQGNVFSFFPGALGRFFLLCYAKVLKVCPGLYAASYRWGNRNSSSLWMRDRINSVLLRLGRSFIERTMPDLVFSTHATPTGIMSLYKEKYNPNVWLGVAVTDFTVHRWLVCKGVDAYFLADEKLFPFVHGKRLAYGIPVRRAFSEERDIVSVRKDLRREFGWEEDAFVCLLAGGGGGMLPMEEILGAVMSSVKTGIPSGEKGNGPSSQEGKQNPGRKGIRVIAVTGYNEALRRKLQTLEPFYSNKEKGNGSCYDLKNEPWRKDTGRKPLISVVGFTDKMPQMMMGSDLVITKGGGVSLAECLACGADVVVYDPLPGQEKANTVFVQKEYGVKTAGDAARLAEIVRQAATVDVAERLRAQEQRKRAFGRPDAAVKIAEFTENLRNIM